MRSDACGGSNNKLSPAHTKTHQRFADHSTLANKAAPPITSSLPVHQIQDRPRINASSLGSASALSNPVAARALPPASKACKGHNRVERDGLAQLCCRFLSDQRRDGLERPLCEVTSRRALCRHVTVLLVSDILIIAAISNPCRNTISSDTSALGNALLWRLGK